MMALKYPTLSLSAETVKPSPGLFCVEAQGAASLTEENHAELMTLLGHIRQRLTAPVRMTCHPHRVGFSNSVALHLEGTSGGQVDILLTVSGQSGWPAESDYAHPRWYLTVQDTVDAFYLVLWLNEKLQKG
ncbi:TPA: acetyltransferase [Escherichia coli]|uniref:hypothetical protein n=1 Tax=Escherichia coli TaxID=562 RepID=UPI00038FBE30|nr:hypothetical protein [Escherichia coli]EQW65662.1 hypothetical protein G909_02962 [Escherichia coli UMEA 3113-1]HAH2493216.1 acetyltransferase [Escherichia coli]HCX5867534.1 acetyltransferase [Escherichia coli]